MKMSDEEIKALIEHCKKNGVCSFSLGELSFEFFPEPKKVSLGNNLKARQGSS